MGFQQGLSGLNGAAKQLDAISNNISNANTVGFKSSEAQFADVYAASLGGAGGGSIGIGTNLASVSQQFTQGNINTTNNALDVAINGSGMFRLSDNGTISYTRSGQFHLDKNGFLVNSANIQVTGYAADPVTGTIIPGNMTPLQVNNTNIAPQVTSKSQIQVNLDSRSATPAAMTSGSLTGTKGLVSPITVAGGANTLSIVVDGVTASATLDPASYPLGTLLTTLEDKFNAVLNPLGAGVTVTTDVNSHLVITSNSKGTIGSQGTGSNVAFSAGGGNAVTALFGAQATAPAIAVAGADNFNPTTSGTLTGTVAFTAGLAAAMTGGAGSTATFTIDGTTAAIDIGTGGGWGSVDAAKQGIQNAINSNATMTAAGKQVKVDIDPTTGYLVITSVASGTGSNVSVNTTVGYGAQVSAAFGASPITVAGSTDLTTINNLGFTSSTAQTVYDSLGNGHNLALYFVKSSRGNNWQLYTTLDGGQQQGPTTMRFDGAGALIYPPMPMTLPAANSSYTFTTGANKLTFTMDLTGSTQYGIASGVNQLTQDGYTSGRLSGISVAADGTLLGSYSNGKTRNMGQIVLVTFNNTSGLATLGGNQWAETAESGQPIPGTPGQGSLGVIQSASIEESNVDLTKELVSMITAQRNYQANAQTIKTQDTIMQTLVNLG